MDFRLLFMVSSGEWGGPIVSELGNYPRALPHVVLINAAWRLTEAAAHDTKGTP